MVTHTMKRLFKNLFFLPSALRTSFPPEVLRELEEAVRNSETVHSGQIKIVIECSLSPWQVLLGKQARERAVNLFSKHRIWDTEDNDGVLIYILLSERRFEFVCDRGINRVVESEYWTRRAEALEVALREGRFREGLLEAVSEVTEVLCTHFPESDRQQGELCDAPVVIW